MEWLTWSPWNLFDAQESLSAFTGRMNLRIISHNIRYATSDPFPNEQPWSRRAPLLLNQLEHETRFITVSPSTASQPGMNACQHYGAFICLQEVLHTQLVDIMAGLNHLVPDNTSDTPAQGPLWSYIGVGRDDGKVAGEYSPIIYPTELFSPLEHRTFWLSPTPSRPSRGWDAASVRILNICVFEHTATRHRILAANTHLDDQGSISRSKSAELILKLIGQWHLSWSKTGREDLGVFLTGDFNSKPEDAAYRIMNNSRSMIDAHEAVGVGKRYGEEITFTSFEPEKGSEDIGRIDFVWLRSSETRYQPDNTSERPTTDQDADIATWEVEGYAVLPNVFDDGVYLSDHRAIVVDAMLGT